MLLKLEPKLSLRGICNSCTIRENICTVGIKPSSRQPYYPLQGWFWKHRQTWRNRKQQRKYIEHSVSNCFQTVCSTNIRQKSNMFFCQCSLTNKKTWIQKNSRYITQLNRPNPPVEELKHFVQPQAMQTSSSPNPPVEELKHQNKKTILGAWYAVLIHP